MSDFIFTQKQTKELLEELYTLRAENKLLKERYDLAQRVSDIEKFCERVEVIETDMEYFEMGIRKALKKAESFNEFKELLKEFHYLGDDNE